jgi:hypothetical protein
MHKLLRTKLTLKKRADTLRTLLRHTASEYQLNKAAERVREARIRVLQAKIGEMPTLSARLTAQHQKRISKLSIQIESLRSTPLKEILTEFRQMLSKVHGRQGPALHG